MKKVLIVATVQSHIAQFHKPLMKLLKENGYEVHIVARDNLEEKNGLELEYVDKVYDINFNRSPFSLKNVTAYKHLKKIINENKYDIINCNTPVGGVLTRLACKKARKNGTKVYYTVHGFHFYKGASKKNWIIYYPIEKLLSKKCDKIITITDEDYELAKKKFKTEIVRLHGVGANSSKYYVYDEQRVLEVKKKLKVDENSPVLLSIGELLENKNQKIAIYAMTKIVEKYKKAKLLIAGNGKTLNQLKTIVKENRLTDNVVFCGYRNDLNDFINACDILITCSYREGLPLNVIEAMMCGKPVIASNNRGHRELVDDKNTGFIVPYDEYEEIANKVNILIKDEKLYEMISNNALEKSKKYIDKTVVKELKEIYEV